MSFSWDCGWWGHVGAAALYLAAAGQGGAHKVGRGPIWEEAWIPCPKLAMALDRIEMRWEERP